MTRPLDAASRAKLVKRFAAIPDRLKATARRVIEEEAGSMVEEMKRGAPRDDGDLQASIRHADDSTDFQIKRRVSAGGPLTTKPVRNSSKGNAPTYDYANAAEHGTIDTPATPFFFPVYRRRRKRFKAKLARELKKTAEAKGPGGV